MTTFTKHCKCRMNSNMQKYIKLCGNSTRCCLLRLKIDESVARANQFHNGHPSPLLDEVGHSLKLLFRDVDELSSIIHHTTQLSTLLKAVDSRDGFLGGEREEKRKARERRDVNSHRI